MARLDKTIKDYQKQLKNKGIENIPEFIQSILDADITKGKYSRFLLDCYLNDKFRDEDLIGGLEATVGQAISLFHKHKNKLPEDMRSIYQYDSPGSLWQAVKEFDGQLSGKEIKREEQERIYAETEFVYEDENTGFKIVSPLTEDSAKWWGKGTRWCTAAEKNNMFKDYAKEAPLLIFLMPASASTARNGEKIQLWKHGNNIQFMDEADDDVELDYIEQNWSVLEPIMKWLGASNYIPKKYLTEEFFKLAIKQNREALYSIPEKYRTKEICEIAVQQSGGSLSYVPKKMITEEICKMAIQQNGDVLQYVPEEMRTKEMYKMAVQQKGNALRFIPKKMITEELCKLAVQNSGKAFCHIPQILITKEFCYWAIQQNGEALQYIPKKMLTEKICKMAIEQSGIFLQYVPHDMRTEKLCQLSVQRNSYALYLVPDKFKTEELCRLAVEKNGNVLQQIPKHIITEELCKLAVQQDGRALQDIPEHLKTEEVCRLAVQQNGEAIKFTNKQLQKQLKHFVKPEIIETIEIPKEKYQQTFSEIRSFFPEKSLSFKL